MNIKEASQAANVSVRTLRYYEEVGLLQPVRASENGYREYDSSMVGRARLIRAYRELQFSLEEVKSLLDASRMERDSMLVQQIEKLRARRQAIDNRIALAHGLLMIGPERFGEIDFDQVDAQIKQMHENLASNAEWQALSDRLKAQTDEQSEAIAEGLVQHLAAVASANDAEPAILALIRFVEENLYPCTDQLLTVYARSFGGDGLLAQSVEEIAGPGSPRILRERLENYIKNTACK